MEALEDWLRHNPGKVALVWCQPAESDVIDEHITVELCPETMYVAYWEQRDSVLGGLNIGSGPSIEYAVNNLSTGSATQEIMFDDLPAEDQQDLMDAIAEDAKRYDSIMDWFVQEWEVWL